MWWNTGNAAVKFIPCIVNLSLISLRLQYLGRLWELVFIWRQNNFCFPLQFQVLSVQAQFVWRVGRKLWKKPLKWQLQIVMLRTSHIIIWKVWKESVRTASSRSTRFGDKPVGRSDPATSTVTWDRLTSKPNHIEPEPNRLEPLTGLQILEN